MSKPVANMTLISQCHKVVNFVIQHCTVVNYCILPVDFDSDLSGLALFIHIS